MEQNKILIINYEYPPLGGGGGVATKIFSEELAKLGHQVVVITTHYRGLKFKERLNSVTIYRVPVLFRNSKPKASLMSLLTWPVTSVPLALWLCLNYKFDVINTQFLFPSGPTGWIASKLFGVKNIFYLHGADIYDPERIESTPSGKGLFARILKKIGEEMLQDSYKISCQSNDIKQRIESIYPFVENKITLIPLPFKKPEFEINNIQKTSHNHVKLISIGRLVKRKGFEYLLLAMSLLPKYINVELELIGDGPLRSDLIILAKKYDLLDTVRIRGKVSEEEKYQLLAESDIYVLPSLHEGMGIVLQEAMYAGLPIISTNVGGQNDLLTNGINAIMIEPQDPEALKMAILKLYEDKPLRTMLGNNNRESIKRFYSEAIVKEFETLILD